LVSDQYFDTAVVTTGNDLLKSGSLATEECQCKEDSYSQNSLQKQCAELLLGPQGENSNFVSTLEKCAHRRGFSELYQWKAMAILKVNVD
jgi:hypothetical protein